MRELIHALVDSPDAYSPFSVYPGRGRAGYPVVVPDPVLYPGAGTTVYCTATVRVIHGFVLMVLYPGYWVQYPVQ